MGQTVEISFDGIKEWFEQTTATVTAWLEDYFSRIDTYGILAVSAIGIGFILFIVGLFLL